MSGGAQGREPPALRFRHPTEDDHLRVIRLIEDWWDQRGASALLPRMWFRHFAGSSWIAENEDGDTVGFVVGLVSADRPEEARLQLVGVDPNLRRRGVGRSLVDLFAATVRERGATRLEAVVWAGDRASISFLTALGFSPYDGPGTTPVYGMRAYADYDTEADDKVLLLLRID